jgi:sugar/nucleoside kinase (ribokinase family)
MLKAETGNGDFMDPVNSLFDIVFVGHMCYDEIIPFGGTARISPGSAVLCGALAAARIGKKVAVVTRMAQKDEQILAALKQAGIEVFVTPTAETTYSKVIHPSEDVDDRQILLMASAGFFSLAEMPGFRARHLHLAGISDQEFNLEFLRGLKEKGYSLSVDMQSFVRQVDPLTRHIHFREVSAKREIVRLMDKVKLDIVEAKVLTGTDNLEAAAKAIEEWGCPEIVITQAEGVLARAQGQTLYEKFSNRSVVGRTGRGDTTFAAYLGWRMDHNVADALKFASALVSIKMETPGPFQGTLEDVFARMRLDQARTKTA